MKERQGEQGRGGGTGGECEGERDRGGQSA